jgi:acyl-CoA thioesterase-1
MRTIGLAVVLTLLAGAPAGAQIVALGDSATKGFHLAEADTWPFKLEALLRQRGLDVRVANAGVNGDTSEGMLGRLDSAVPEGARVVIFACCGNDNKDPRHAVADHDANMRELFAKLRARAAAVVFSAEHGAGVTFPNDKAIAQRAGAIWCGGIYQGVAPEDIEVSEAGRHPNARGTDAIAARMLPCVLRALRAKGG